MLPTKTRLQQYERLCPHCGEDRRALRKMLAGKDSKEREKAARTIENCRSCANALYETYRRFTGKCEVCHAPIQPHPRCDACGILCGMGHENVLSPYRGHDLCGPCIKAWKVKDNLFGKEMTWSEFAHSHLHPRLLQLWQEKVGVRR